MKKLKIALVYLLCGLGAWASEEAAPPEKETEAAEESARPFWNVPLTSEVLAPQFRGSNALGQVSAPASNQVPGSLLQINPALRASSDLISNSNLLSGAHDLDKRSPVQEAQFLFNLARTQHLQKDYEQAAQSYTAMLHSEASQTLKQYALLELAIMAQKQEQLARAQQIFAQYLKKYPNDPAVPELLLRQGLLYRQMGTPTMALRKFYAVMTTALRLKEGHLDYYQRLVLHAQTEIADTYYQEGNFEQAAEYLFRLLKLDAPELNAPAIHFKLVRCLAALGRHPEAITQARDFLKHYSEGPEVPEVRFLLAKSFKQTGRKQEALQQVFEILKSQEVTARKNLKRWAYWQQRTGNEIGNELYQEQDFLGALEVYTLLASLSSAPGWQVPVLYQIGLVYERLQQPQKAAETYQQIISRQKELESNPSPSLKTLVDMAQWRKDFLKWQVQAERFGQTNAPARAVAPLSAAR